MSFLHSLDNKLSLCCGLLIIFLYGLSEAAWSPFLPTEYSDRGLNETTTGIIVAAYQLSYLVGSLLFMVKTSSNYRRFIFCAASVSSGTCLVLFGQLNSINSNAPFVSLSILLRCLIGLCTGTAYCSLAAFLLSKFPNDTGKLFRDLSNTLYFQHSSST